MKRLLLTMAMGLAMSSGYAQNALNLGGDISMLPQYESVNTPYYTSVGGKIPNVLTYMKQTCKMNSMRVRLFVTPNANEAKDGVVQDLEYVKNLGKRIKAEGMDFMLDFQYSDTWADPSNQNIPSTWKTNTTNAVLTDSMYTYTKRCLEYLKENDATPDFVQIGNEISYGMLWRNYSDRCYSNATAATWKRLTDFLSAGAKAVREVTPDAKIILHVERTGDANSCVDFFNKMEANGVDYDIIGLSYYPFWHKLLPSLNTTLNTLATKFPNKPVQIVETAYYYQYFPSDYPDQYDNTTSVWAATPAGQQAFIEDLCTELAKHTNVTGLYYWFPEENGSGGATWNANNVVLQHWINRGLWDNNSHKINPALLKLQNFLTQKEALSIDGVQADNNESDAPTYTLSGQRVTSMSSPGIYIRGKKKYLISTAAH